MEQCSIDEIIGDKRAVMMEEGEIENFAVYEQDKPISILRQMPYTVVVKRRQGNVLDENIGFSYVNMRKENVSCILQMMTRPDKRHLGLSDEVMHESLLRQREQGRAFTYHNPENMQEAVQYQQFGFAPVADNITYIRKKDILTDDMLCTCMQTGRSKITGTDYELCLFDQDNMQELLRFVNCELGMRYDIFAIRTKTYYEQMLESLSEYRGQIFLLKKQESIIGYFVMEDVLAHEICREALFLQDEARNLFFAERKGELPLMARIVNLRSMAKHICSEGKVTIAVRVEDPMLRDNNGTYIWYLDEKGSRLEKVETENLPLPRPELSVTIGEFTSILMGHQTINNKKFESVKLLGAVWLPERK